MSVKRQLRDLSSKVGKTIQPVFTSRKLNQDLSLREPKPNFVTQQCVVYLFKCDLCDAGYVGYTKGHLHTRVEGHRQKASSICKHYYKEHNTAVPNNFLARFNVIKKSMNKFDCLVNEMMYIQEVKPTLNVQLACSRLLERSARGRNHPCRFRPLALSFALLSRSLEQANVQSDSLRAKIFK